MKNIETGRTYLWNEILLMNLPSKRFIKDDEGKAHSLMVDKNFHVKTFFEGVTFELQPFTGKFLAVKNEFSTAKVWRFTAIRNIEWEIQKMERLIWSLKMEFKNYELVKIQEGELDVLKMRLVAAIRG